MPSRTPPLSDDWISTTIAFTGCKRVPSPTSSPVLTDLTSPVRTSLTPFCHLSPLCPPGNPLNCDCETKWLRNWVSSQERGATIEEPRCYFPKSLSGNPLRQLRSSRFTCATHGNNNLISDACQSLPLKTPAQLHMTAVTDAGNIWGGVEATLN